MVKAARAVAAQEEGLAQTSRPCWAARGDVPCCDLLINIFINKLNKAHTSPIGPERFKGRNTDGISLSSLVICAKDIFPSCINHPINSKVNMRRF